ncbi:MAG: MFS transporter, partial [Planctomycetaceae bacterium]|nr:MFS transporter [Planctomycetaceae bacterium]
MSEQTSLPDGLPMPQRLGAVVAVLLCLAMSAINISLMNISLPTIAKELNAAPEKVIYVVSIYQLVLVIFLLFVAALGDYFGYKQVVLAGVVIFTAASLGCAFSQSLIELIICRVVQGFGATAIQGSYLFLITRIYPKQQLGRGMGLSSMVFAVTAVAGPTVAAVILSFATWHWLFLINIPLGIAGFCLGWYYLPANTVKTEKCSIAVSDTVLHILTFGLFFVAASSFSHHPQQIAVNVSLFAGLMTIAVFYVFLQSKKTLPFFPIDLLRQMSFSFPMSRF